MASVTVAATQMSCTWDREENLDKASALVRAAADAGAQVVLPQEMFATHFFAFMDWKSEYFALAEALDGPTVTRMAALAKELGVVIPINFYERANNAHYNTCAIADADGSILGIYRKTHIPEGPPGCYEKVYTNPGDTGFRVWDTAVGRIGVGICWDQWFPEAARIMCLHGAELLFYPSGIASDCQDHWQRVMQGHAGANLTPLVCSNRVGRESGELGTSEFWGRSFVAGPDGAIVAEADTTSDTFVAASFDLEAVCRKRAEWGVFRDRRPEAYGPLLTLDGTTPPLRP